MPETTPETVTPTATETTAPPAPPVESADADNESDDSTVAEIEALLGGGTPEETEEAPAAETEETTEAAEPEPTAEAETPAEVVETEPAAETPAAEVVAEPALEPAAPANPIVAAAEDKAAADRQLQAAKDAETHRDRVKKYETDQAAFDARVNAEGYEWDPFADGKEDARLNSEFRALQRIESARYRALAERDDHQRAYAAHWSDFDKQHAELGAGTGQKVWEEIYAAVAKKYPDPTAAHAVAQDRFEQRIELRKAQAKAKTPAAPAAPAAPGRIPPKKPPVTKGGASITPKSGTRVPAPAPKSVGDRLDAGVYGDLSKIV